MANPGNNAKIIYNEFRDNWNDMLFQSEKLLYEYQHKNIENSFLSEIESNEQNLKKLSKKTGDDIKRILKTRVNQSLFRQVILGNYFHSCSVCGLNISSLLVASHILKWSDNKQERLNPQNGICLCSIHDKAFELGYLGILPNYKIRLSDKLSKITDKNTFDALFYRHQNNSIKLPDKYYPNPVFLEKHFSSNFLSK